MNRLLVTGGMGFIGSNFIRYMLDKHGDRVRVTNLDLLTYAGNPDNVKDLADRSNYRFVQGDIADNDLVRSLFREGIDTVVHFAAETHVDRSIDDPQLFVRTNVLGTQNLLAAAREYGVERFIHISTDEVYGSLGAKGSFTERTAAAPNSPYSASKAASDFLVRAYGVTYGLPVVITRCSNNYGPYQHPEKLIPKAIIHALQGWPIPVYGSGKQVRDWLHVRDHCAAIDAVIEHGEVCEVYNVGGNNERNNLEMVELIVDLLGQPRSLIRHVEDRPGHDQRYSINARKLRRQTGWQPASPLDRGIQDTIRWYQDNEAWWRPQLAGDSR